MNLLKLVKNRLSMPYTAFLHYFGACEDVVLGRKLLGDINKSLPFWIIYPGRKTYRGFRYYMLTIFFDAEYSNLSQELVANCDFLNSPLS